jgi:antitoxin PrlF
MNLQTFSGKSTPIGNSNGIRFDAALFKTHPEFFGEVKATVLGPGQMLVSVLPAEASPADAVEDENNPVMQAFLHFLQVQMTDHPELIEPMDEAELAQIAALVEGVEPD